MASVDDFIARWSVAGGSERSNAVLFLTELYEVIRVEKPKPATPTSTNDDYCFEHPTKSHYFGEPEQHFIDCTSRGASLLKPNKGLMKSPN